jgi:hypothetical protein
LHDNARINAEIHGHQCQHNNTKATLATDSHASAGTLAASVFYVFTASSGFPAHVHLRLLVRGVSLAQRRYLFARACLAERGFYIYSVRLEEVLDSRTAVRIWYPHLGVQRLG